MCRNGFTAHQGTDGSVPEQRYTEAGGVHMLQENAAGFFDARKRELERRPRFNLDELEHVHLEFMNEVPPADGHRQNVLGARHTSVGIGLARAKGRGFPCLVQVFTDHYGRYAPLPAELRVGAVLRVAGEVFEPARFAGIGVARIDWERPLAPDVLNQRAGYRFPEPDELYFPPGYASRVPVRVEGRAFGLDLPLSGGEPGRYLVSVWARFPGSESLVMVSLRTLRVTR
jgi:hypothetical protein